VAMTVAACSARQTASAATVTNREPVTVLGHIARRKNTSTGFADFPSPFKTHLQTRQFSRSLKA
jgi:hypothetical protein